MKSSAHIPDSILAKRIAKKVLHYYLLLFLLILFALTSIILPILYRDTIRRDTEYADLLSNECHQLAATLNMHMLTIQNSKALSSLLQNSTDSQEEKSSKICLELQSFISLDNRLRLIQIEDENHTIYSSINEHSSPASTLTQTDADYLSWKESNSQIFYSGFLDKSFWNTDQVSTILYSKKITLNNHTYFYSLFYNVDSYLKACQTICDKSFTDFLILNQKSVPIFTTSNSLSVYSAAHLNDFSSLNKHYIDKSGIYFYSIELSTRWIVVAHASWLLFFEDILLIYGILLFFYLITPLMYRMVIIPIQNRSLSPLARLTSAIDAYTPGEDLSVSIQTGDEIEILSNTLNHMTQKIREQIEEIRIQEHKNFAIQYNLQATQIDPHLIYNTLNLVNILARQNQQTEILEINTALSHLMRERFSTKPSIFETIQNELEVTMQYCTIMKYRCENHVLVNINTEPELLGEKIPKNILLPLIENAFFHGLSNADGIFQGEISIDIYSLEDEITIEISDNGKGISAKRLDDLKAHQFRTANTDRRHIGLSNVYERLNYIYKQNFQMNIDSFEGDGTTVILAIPFFKVSMDFENFY